jgi:hypothetical protein
MPEIIKITDKAQSVIDSIAMVRSANFGCVIAKYEPDEYETEGDTRSKAQNRLMWKWNGETSEQTGNSADWVHGESKMLLLNPQLKVWGGKDAERAEFFDAMCEQITDYKYKVFAAYGNIRTKTLGVKKMAWYLTTFERHYSMQGYHLTRTDDYLWAIENKREI